MSHRVVSVTPGGIAEELGLLPGDELISINGEQVLDQVDYQALTAAEQIDLEVCRGGSVLNFSFDKDEEEPLGLVFDQGLMSQPRHCTNHCMFCFVDQMPDGCRSTLYVKDDDWRMSLMMGSYVTLTNVEDREFERIIARHASPLYVSVHTTNPELRVKMMTNPKAGLVMEQLRRLQVGGISFHCQIVLCPGINDGKELDRTLADLESLMPAALSCALVPVGLTAHRNNLARITPFDKESARKVIEQAHLWQQHFTHAHGSAFVYPADELYLMAEMPLPSDEEYGDYAQTENGVGLLRSLEMEFSIAYRMGEKKAVKRRVAMACGTSVAPFMEKLLKKYPLEGLDVRVIPVENHFFGGHVTVSGLLTGSDLLEALAGVEADEILISEAMVRHEGELFLDDLSREEVEKRLAVPLHAVPSDGGELYDALCGSFYDTEVENG